MSITDITYHLVFNAKPHLRATEAQAPSTLMEEQIIQEFVNKKMNFMHTATDSKVSLDSKGLTCHSFCQEERVLDSFLPIFRA